MNCSQDQTDPLPRIERGRLASCFRVPVFLLILIALGFQPSLAQKKSSSLGQKLPSPEKIVEKYLKTIGGKKRLAAIRDATFDWTIQLNAQTREDSLLQMETDRELNNRGEVKKETVKTFEVFPIANRAPILRSKLVGVVWIYPADKQVMRLEARLAEGFKMAGGLLLSLRPGAALVMEQTRMEEGIWLPRLAQVNLSVKVLLFGGGDVNKTIEWSDYKHYKCDVGGYKLDAPKTADAADMKP